MRKRAILLTVALLAVLIASAIPSRSAPVRYKPFVESGLEGSSEATMHSVTLPARVARVAAVPGSAEVWAMGRSLSPIPGWSKEPQGQLVFLKYTPQGGWVLTGPPLDASGGVINPDLSDMALASTGEGWAVGAGGVLLRKEPGSDSWIEHSQSRRVTSSLLEGVSIFYDGAATHAYAVGKDSTILRYDRPSWSVELPTTDMVADGMPGFIGVAILNPNEVWVVSDEASNGLKIYRRTSSVWRKVSTGNRVFDGPFPAVGPNGTTNRGAWGSAIAGMGSTVLIGGKIRPSSRVPLLGSEDSLDETRPFIIRVRITSFLAFTSYCPDMYTLRQRGTGVSLNTTSFCDQAFPTAPLDIPSISMVSENEAFAGGLGLFHFKDNGWLREPNSDGYLISVSMSSPTEGWTASGGNTYGRGNTIRAATPLVGHWTAGAPSPSLARWPHTQRKGLEAVASSPDGTMAVAVGQQGAAIVFDRRTGWNEVPPYVTESLHAVAWPGKTAWAVGDRGLIAGYNGKWTIHPDSGVLRRALFGVAFTSPSDGVAVGVGGTILRFDGSRWRPDPQSGVVTQQTLYSVTPTPSGYVAVGREGTVIEFRGGSWTGRAEVADILRKPTRSDLPQLYAATTTASGQVVVGGDRNALLIADPGGPFRAMEAPLDGMVMALAAPRGGTSDRVFASVSPDDRKYAGETIGAIRGTVLMYSGGVWRDVQFNRKISTSPANDSSSFDDPVFGLATYDGVTGWAAGGTPAGLQSEEGHLRSHQTGSIYRINVAGDPSPPFSAADLKFPTGVNFAVFGESWCGKGLCSAAAGTGMMADSVALRIRDEINRAASMPNGPKFVLFTGNMRIAGIPEELGEFRAFLDGFQIPVFAAVGNRDLFAGLDPLTLAGRVVTQLGTQSGTNEPWKEFFSDAPRPWGGRSHAACCWPGDPKAYITPVATTAPYNAQHARTHYAFDVVQEGKEALRVIVLDSSTKKYGEPSDQNPREPQGTFFNTVASEAKAPPPLGKGIPSIVMMNQPTIFPGNAQLPNWTLDQGSFEGTAAGNGVTAVFTGGLRMNAIDSIPYPRGGIVPVYILGGGGAPLGFDNAVTAPTKLPHDGFYHAWHLVTIDPAPEKRNLLGQAPHRLITFPVLETLAMHSYEGESIKVGNTMRFSALGRSLLGGWSDPEQSKATYIHMGALSLPVCPNYGQGNIYCQSRNAVRSPYRFRSEDPTAADFVLPDFGRGGATPRLHPVTGAMLLDPTGEHGLLCTFKTGPVGINVESGFHRARMVINILPGFGPCIDKPILALTSAPPPFNVESPQAVEEEGPRFIGRNPPPLDILAFVIPPAPGPIPAPAPPASAAGARKEEEEYQHESEGQQEKREKEGAKETSNFSVYLSEERRQSFDPTMGWLVAGSAALMALMGAAAAATVKRRDPHRLYVKVRIDR